MSDPSEHVSSSYYNEKAAILVFSLIGEKTDEKRVKSGFANQHGNVWPTQSRHPLNEEKHHQSENHLMPLGLAQSIVASRQSRRTVRTDGVRVIFGLCVDCL